MGIPQGLRAPSGVLLSVAVLGAVDAGRTGGMLSREDEVEIVALHRRGWSISAIARSGRDRKTEDLVCRRSGAKAAPGERARVVPRVRREAVQDDPHLDATVLLRELVGLGFQRSYPTLTRELRRRLRGLAR